MSISHVTATAPSKVILFGEHSVVYGKMALVAALDRRLKMSMICREDNSSDCMNCGKWLSSVSFDFPSLSPDNVSTIILKSNDLDEFSDTVVSKKDSSTYNEDIKRWLSLKLKPTVTTAMRDSVGAILSILISDGCLPCKNLRIGVESDIPVGSGLGSSAAISVTAAAGSLVLKGILPSDSNNWNDDHYQQVSDLAYIGEKVFHGTPSGLDNMICTFGGVVAYSRTSGSRLMKIYNRVPILVVDTMIQRSTAHLVGLVRSKLENEKDKCETIFSEIESLVHKAIEMITSYSISPTELVEGIKPAVNVEKRIGSLFDENQKLLRELGVSHSAIEDVLKIINKFGLSGKLTGAGGGGCVISIIPLNFTCLEEMLDYLREKGYSAWIAPLGADGVRTEDWPI